MPPFTAYSESEEGHQFLLLVDQVASRYSLNPLDVLEMPSDAFLFLSTLAGVGMKHEGGSGEAMSPYAHVPKMK